MGARLPLRLVRGLSSSFDSAFFLMSRGYGGMKRSSRGLLLILADFCASVLSPKYEVFCCDQNGPPARRSEPDWRMEGAYLKRYVTDEQRSRRPILIATLWAGASWLFFRVARSTRMTKIWALRSRLEKQPTDLRQNTSYFRGQDTSDLTLICSMAVAKSSYSLSKSR